MTQYGFYFDQSRCYNCRACVLACRDWLGIEPGPVKPLRILQWEEGAFPQPRLNLVFANCYHCEKPVCVDACEHHALFKEEKYGAVLLDTEACEGDRNCWKACPYGAPQYESDAPGTKMQKCNMCFDRLERGEIPVCVAACPGRALDFGPLDELEAKYGELKQLEGMPSPDVAYPAIVFTKMVQKEDLVTYNEAEAVELFQHRPYGLPDMFDAPEDVTDLPEGLVGKAKLVMKSANVQENLDLSKGEDG